VRCTAPGGDGETTKFLSTGGSRDGDGGGGGGGGTASRPRRRGLLDCRHGRAA